MEQQYGVDLRLLNWIKNSIGHCPKVFNDLTKIICLDNKKVNRFIDTYKTPSWLVIKDGDFSLIGEMNNL